MKGVAREARWLTGWRRFLPNRRHPRRRGVRLGPAFRQQTAEDVGEPLLLGGKLLVERGCSRVAASLGTGKMIGFHFLYPLVLVDSVCPLWPNIVSLVSGWDLGVGESEVLSFAHGNPGYRVMVDDAQARKCARRWGPPHWEQGPCWYWPNAAAFFRPSQRP